VIAEAQQKNIESVGMPAWTDADQTLAKALQKEIGAKVEGLKEKVEPLEEPAKTLSGGGSDDVGDISWNVPMVYLMFPANIPNLPGHSWPNAVAMATPIAHKGSTAGAKVQALTALDFLLRPQLVTQAWDYFRNVQTKDVHYESFLAPTDQPPSSSTKKKCKNSSPTSKSSTSTHPNTKPTSNNSASPTPLFAPRHNLHPDAPFVTPPSRRRCKVLEGFAGTRSVFMRWLRWLLVIRISGLRARSRELSRPAQFAPFAPNRSLSNERSICNAAVPAREANAG